MTAPTELLATFANSASASGRAAEAGLQAAIWYVIYYGHKDGSGNPLFQYVPSDGTADPYYNADVLAVTKGLSDPTKWRTADVSQFLWTSPSNDPLISPTHHSDYIYQALVTSVPEPSTMAIAGLGALLMVVHGLRRRPAKG